MMTSLSSAAAQANLTNPTAARAAPGTSSSATTILFPPNPTGGPGLPVRTREPIGPQTSGGIQIGANGNVDSVPVTGQSPHRHPYPHSQYHPRASFMRPGESDRDYIKRRRAEGVSVGGIASGTNPRESAASSVADGNRRRYIDEGERWSQWICKRRDLQQWLIEAEEARLLGGYEAL